MVVNLKEPSALAAEIVNVQRNGLAALAADRLLADHPEIAVRYRPTPAVKWRESFASRLTYLVAALETNQPQAFGAQAAWAKAATFTRSGPEGVRDLELGYAALQRTLLHELPASTHGPVSRCMQAAMKSLHSAPSEVPSTLSVATPHGRLAAEYLMAILEGDRHRACHLVLDKVKTGALSVRQVYLDVIHPVQVELGRLWHMNESTVAEEHFCTATTQMLMSLLYPYLPRAPRNGKTVVAASVEGNAHDLGIRVIADFLEMDGWKSVYLGPSVPPDDLALAVADFSADLLCLSASLSPQLCTVRASIAAVRAGPYHIPHPCCERVKILVGGSAFLFGASADSSATSGTPTTPLALAQSLGADAYASTPDEAVRFAASIPAGS